MNKKLLAGLLLLTTFTGIAWMAFSSVAGYKERKTQEALRAKRFATIPALPFSDLKGASTTLDEVAIFEPLVLVLFNSECGFCQYEIAEISKNIGLLADSQLIFLSTEPREVIQAFAQTYPLYANENVIFGQVELGSLLEVFTEVSFPNIFLFDAQGDFLREFKGEVRVGLLQEVIRGDDQENIQL